MSRQSRPGFGWILEQFTKAEIELIAGEGNIRSRMRLAAPYIYSFNPDGIPDSKLRGKVVKLCSDMQGDFPNFTEALRSRRMTTLSKLALRMWDLSAQLHALDLQSE